MSKPKIEKFKMQFRVALTKEEKHVVRERLVNVLDETDQLRIKSKQTTDELKKQVEQKEGQVGSLRMDLRVGELREVECERVYDFEAGEVKDIRLDTGEVVSKRKITDHDRQLYLLGAEDGAAKATAKA